MSHSPSPPEQAAPAKLPTLEQRLEGLPSDVAMLLQAARAALEQRKADEAERWLEQALARAEHHPERLRLAGIARHLQGQPQALRIPMHPAPG